MVTVVALLAFGGCAVVGVQGQDAETSNKYSRLGYEALFTHGTLHQIEIVFSPEEWQGLLRDMRVYAAEDPNGRPLTGNYRQATFIYHGPAGDAVIEDVGFRVKGHFSRPYPEDAIGNFHRAHFKIKFNKAFDEIEGTAAYEERDQRRFAKQRELELRMPVNNAETGVWDTTQIRELYAYELMRAAGTNTSRTGSAQLTITVGGEQHYFGIYTLIEPIDKSFLTKRYGSGANDGNLYKCLWGDSGPANLGPIDDPNNFVHAFAGNPQIIGVKDWRSHYRPTYDLKRNTENPDHTELLDFIGKLNTLDGPALKTYLDANFEVDRFLRYLAMNFLIGKWDDYWSIGNNYYLYFNNDGKIEFFSVDYDMAFGDGWALFDTANVGIYDWGNRNRRLLEVLAPQIPEETLDEWADYDYPLVDKLFEIAEYRQLYEAYLEEFINPANGLFLYSEFEKKFNQMYPVYLPYLDNEMGEGTEMYINDRVKRYYYDKTRSVISQLGLNEADYEIPPFEDLPIGMPAPAEPASVTTTTPARDLEPAGDLLSAAMEVSSERYGFSFLLPDDWTETTATSLYEAMAPSEVTGVFVSAWNGAWGERLEDVLPLAFSQGPVEIVSSTGMVTPDGTAAFAVEYRARIAGWDMHVYAIGARRGGWWVAMNLWNIDQYAAFDAVLFREIAGTLRFD
ncbi:MAG: CotH kinase family protein [Dehalococcoidales bacterium]